MPYANGFLGVSFNTQTYPNSNDDIYGSWTLTELEDQKTFIHYENYADPGFWGRQFIGTVIQNTVQDLPNIIGVIKNHL